MNKYEITQIGNQSIIIYYEDNVEFTREVYVENYIIKPGYENKSKMGLPEGHSIPFIEGDYLYNFYLELLKDDSNLNEEGFLSTIGNYKLNKEIKSVYSEKISNIVGMREAVEKFVIDGTPIPQIIINQRDTLKAEFYTITNTLY
jgi:predicted adenine nucleotide alpha hydrolase (AANH) superfamily ATPase